MVDDDYVILDGEWLRRTTIKAFRSFFRPVGVLVRKGWSAITKA
jgi:hypothetical protein